MSSATELTPRFRVGEWVSYRFGLDRVLVQIVEDRGPIGYRGRRLYGVRIDRNQPDPRTTEVAEEDLEEAPTDHLPVEVARQGGFTTENWPRQEFSIKYICNGKANHWRTTLELGRALEGVYLSGVVGSSTARWESQSPGDETVEIIAVLLEYDPRLRDVRTHPDIWRVMVEEAQRQADRSFKSKHPKAVIERG